MSNKTKRNWKAEVKGWWNDNKSKIKVGATCLVIGAFYGFIKGVGAGHDTHMKLLDKIPNNDINGGEGDFVYDETTVDDPELLEMIQSGDLTVEDF